MSGNRNIGDYFWDNVKKRLNDLHWKTNLLAEQTGIHKNNIVTNAIYGRIPRLDAAFSIAASLGLTIEELFNYPKYSLSEDIVFKAQKELSRNSRCVWKHGKNKIVFIQFLKQLEKSDKQLAKFYDNLFLLSPEAQQAAMFFDPDIRLSSVYNPTAVQFDKKKLISRFWTLVNTKSEEKGISHYELIKQSHRTAIRNKNSKGEYNPFNLSKIADMSLSEQMTELEFVFKIAENDNCFEQTFSGKGEKNFLQIFVPSKDVYSHYKEIYGDNYIKRITASKKYVLCKQKTQNFSDIENLI